MIQFSTAVRNAQAAAIEATIGTSAIMKIYDGAIPANCAAASVGTVIATANLPSDYLAAPSAGAVAKSGTWEDTAADAGGLMRYYRVFASDGTTCHIQALVSEPWAASKAYLLNQQVHNGGLVYKVTTAGTSAGSGGPTGTGTGITDGSVTWAYVGTVDMTFDNTNTAIGQNVVINAYSITSGNA